MSNDQDSFEDHLQQREYALHTTQLAISPRGFFPNTILSVTFISLLLGATASFGLSLVFGAGSYWWMTPQLGFFITSWAVFHYCEFATTAGWNPTKCSVDSFVLDNGSMYHIANGTALFEYLVTLYFWPSNKSWPYLSLIGAIVTLGGQILRSAAMIHAGTNFSHLIARQKKQDHVLVTDGVYAWFRHPSYAGFFYWAAGTQLILQNPISFVFFLIVMWRFFNNRIRYEEYTLMKFFPEEYPKYKQRVPTRIPFVR